VYELLSVTFSVCDVKDLCSVLGEYTGHQDYQSLFPSIAYSGRNIPEVIYRHVRKACRVQREE